MKRRLGGVWLGRRRYAPVHALQERLLARRQAGEIGDLVLFLEHEPVVTFGRGARQEHLLASPETLSEHGIELARCGRGGDVTLHLPGQLVAYPILDLSPERRDVRRFVRDLTETMRRLASELGVETGSHPEHIGLWADARSPRRFESDGERELVKVGAIGVRISRWVTMHGFALNLQPDLSLYRFIVPCGIRAHGVASLASLGAAPVELRAAARRSFELFADVFEASPDRFSDRAEQPLESLLAGSEPVPSEAASTS